MSTISASTTTTTAFKVTADTTGALVLQTGSSPTTAMTITSGQQVGVGTATPVTAVNRNVTISTASGGAGLSLQDTGVSSKFELIAGAGGANAFGIYDLSASAYRLNINSSGAVTAPSTPAFLAKINGSAQTIANLASATVTFGDEIYDQAGNYNPSTYTFTAPVTGRYLLTARVRIDNITTNNYATAQIRTSNRDYQSIFSANTIGNYIDISVTAVADMDANDTAYFQVTSNGQTISLVNGQPVYSDFSGYLAA